MSILDLHPTLILLIPCHMFHPTSKFYSPFKRDNLFGSLGNGFDHKWIKNGIVRPHNVEDTHQTIYWARLTTKENPNSTATLIITPIILVPKPKSTLTPISKLSHHCAI